MIYDVFLSICQTPVDGKTPSEREMFLNFFDQVKSADQLGFDTAWVAETHLSCQIQKENPGAVIPDFQGEIGLNTDILQLAQKIFSQTKNINVGSAIMNILCNGGPIAHAEAIKTFLSLHGLDETESRKLKVGFAAGRFPFSNTPYGIVPRSKTEEAAWPVVKGKIFQEATEIFLRTLQGEHVSSKDIKVKTLEAKNFRSEEDWKKVVEVYKDDSKYNSKIDGDVKSISLEPIWKFDKVGVIPFEPRMELLEMVIGSHDPDTQKLANEICPTKVFNLSITPSDKIEAAHEQMKKNYHSSGGEWQREYMPRTCLVFVNNDSSLSPEQQTEKAYEAGIKANQNYWKAMQGTIDDEKVKSAVENGIYGNPKDVAEIIKAKYNKDDRLMLWFDFNNHDNEEIKNSMKAFMQEVVPLLEGIA